MMNKYSFCENVHAGPCGRWHIRKLTKEGKKFGGGADTLSLCKERVDWDVNVKLTTYYLDHNACPKCLKKLGGLYGRLSG